MALYDILKDAASAAQKAQMIELLQVILGAQQMALDLQAENMELRKENYELKNANDLESRIERDKNNTIVVLKDDKDKITYCSVCWDDKKKLIQVSTLPCRICGNIWRK